MNQTNRLPQGGRVQRGASVRFTFNGKAYVGLQGDTLASALLANGVHFVARSFKYHRPRGIMTAGVEEPNALVQLESGPYTVPNARATEVELYEGLSATSVNAKPDIERDRLAVMQRFARFIPAGFYYKTFMWPRSWWGKYEERIRDAAGLGSVPDEQDPARYEKRYAHCDVLVVGAGPAGLAAACAAGRTGARVILVDDGSEAGGSLLRTQETIDGQSALAWVAQRVAELAAQPETQVLQRTTAFGYQDHNLLTACERLHDHLPIMQRSGVRERIWKIRARHVVLATGAHERPLVFGNNDIPGVMMAAAVSAYIHRYGVLPGHRAVVFTNNDSAYQTAIDLKQHGADVTVVDPRVLSHGTLPTLAEHLGIRVIHQTVVAEARGRKHVSGVRLRGHGASLRDGVDSLACDLLVMSGGWNPVVHLYAQSRGKLRWCDARACFVPDVSAQPQSSAGAANGDFSLKAALDGGVQAGLRAAQGAVSTRPAELPAWSANSVEATPLLPLWAVNKGKDATRGSKQFIDYQNDVSVSDILLAVSEGYHSVEHVKRYTAMGFGTDQGKLGNINGMGVLAEALKQSIPATGTTTFRPNYTPVSFGAMAGRELGDWFDPIRRTCLHDWNLEQGAIFEDVGNWKRAHYYPKSGEDMHAAVRRECLAVRNSVGILDYSTLGKIDVRGPDAVEFLNRLYINSWTKLQPGRCRYGLLLDENGMVMDDGVSIRLAEDHFLLTTTTSGAARIMSWMERWLQTEWPDLRVYLTSVTDQYAVTTIAGPNARKVLSAVCKDIDFSNGAFPFMSFQEGTIDGVFARVLRVSFSGELSYEVYVPANMGRHVAERLMQAGKPYDITPYGTETMHVLRGEKGYIIVGQDTDGSVTPMDLGMGGMLAKTKDCLGKRSLGRSHTSGSGRKQFVGLLANDPTCVLPEGGQILQGPTRAAIAPMFGHVTSSYMSPVLGRSIALAMLKDGQAQMGHEVTVATADGQFMPARVCSPVFYDPEGARQNVD
ncbi:sarcosine oxidase subunit alpha family protein [Castellaniella caeni]|uniref:sarcosine oxidase subunit alpha family protein n=1 Tax=Castellaniella caeni TaxID=266123 RepID=UPI00083198AC|nr:sarcosine oxidase subunit alpha family protein [Castellaniella caeni]